MNKKLAGLLVAFVAIGAAYASESNNKTHLNTRICRDCVPAYTTFHEMIGDKNDDRLGGNVEATGFYGASVNGSHLAKSFGADGTGSVFLYNTATAATPELKEKRPKVWNDLLLHNQLSQDNFLAGTINFDPEQTVYGVRLDYFQRFDKWVDGLFLHVILPFVHVTNDINMTVANSVGGIDNSTEKITPDNLLKGNTITRVAPANKQDALCFARMCGNSNTGLDDIEARVGWRFLEGHKYHAGIHGAVIFPTGDEPDAKYLWGARTGESKWGLGIGIDGSALLWEKNDQNLKIIGAFQYKYLFSDTEKRTLGLKQLRYATGTTPARDILKNPILSPYYLVGEAGKIGLKPLANVSTLNVKVEPGSQIDTTVAFAYNNGGFTVDFGYNLFWKEAERVSLKSCSCWDENKYGVASPTYDATAVFNPNGSNTINTLTDKSGFIKRDDLDTHAAETPAQVIHKPFLGVGYIAKSWEYPVMIGAGVAYEIPSSNRDVAEGYSFWAKAGVAF